MKKYITCHYQGRLGNLLFEIAATLAAAWRNGMTPCFPKKYPSYYNSIPAFQEYILPLLDQFHQYEEGEIEFNDYHEASDFHYQEMKFTENTRLIGYFTTYRYFDRERSIIRNLFIRDGQEVWEKFVELRGPLGAKCVAVHVRRTDYVTDYNSALPLDYYKQAVKFFPAYSKFIIFSDDHEWCEKNLDFMLDKVFIKEKDYIEIQLMGLFDGAIIANSTFSAIAMMLHNQENVVAPRNWYPTNYNKDIQEPHWKLI